MERFGEECWSLMDSSWRRAPSGEWIRLRVVCYVSTNTRSENYYYCYYYCYYLSQSIISIYYHPIHIHLSIYPFIQFLQDNHLKFTLVFFQQYAYRSYNIFNIFLTFNACIFILFFYFHVIFLYDSFLFIMHFHMFYFHLYFMSVIIHHFNLIFYM